MEGFAPLDPSSGICLGSAPFGAGQQYTHSGLLSSLTADRGMPYIAGWQVGIIGYYLL
jgi:hypothetical protein